MWYKKFIELLQKFRKWVCGEHHRCEFYKRFRNGTPDDTQ